MEIAGYTDLTPLAAGASSDLYRAWRDEDGLWVALKIFRFSLPDDRAKRRYLRDLDQARSVADHPGIATLYDAGMADGNRPYLAMQLVEGGSVGDRLASGPLDVHESLQVGIDAAEALEAAHRAGVLHRDLQPTSVLVDADHGVILTEIGVPLVAERWDAAADTDGFLPYHASPEVLERTPPSPASDVYSLASTIYTLLAGHPPHKTTGTDSVSALLLRVLQHKTPPLSRPGVPVELYEAIRAALEPDPAERTPTAQIFREQLVGVLDRMEVASPAASGDGSPVDHPPPENSPGAAPPPVAGVTYRPAPGAAVPEAPADRPAGPAFDHGSFGEDPFDGDLVSYRDPFDNDLVDRAGFAGSGDPFGDDPFDSDLVDSPEVLMGHHGPGPVLDPSGGPLAEDQDRRRRRKAWMVLGGGVTLSLALLLAGLNMSGSDSSDPVEQEETAATQPADDVASRDRNIADDDAQEDSADSGDEEGDEAEEDEDRTGEDSEGGDHQDADDPEDDPLDLSAPTGLTTHASEAGVLLEWDEAGTDRFAVLILSETEPPRIETVNGGTSLLVPALTLKPDDGYCFAVARLDVVARLSDSEDELADQVGSAFSSMVCIRGAAENTIRTG